MHEIVTLQFGRASFVGSHNWNINDEYLSHSFEDPPIIVDPFYHQREINGQITFVPRLLAIDLRGSFRTFENTAQDLPLLPWNGPIETIERVEEEPNEFQKYLLDIEQGKTNDSTMDKSGDEQTEIGCNDADFGLDESVSTWSDYLQARIHNQSILELPVTTNDLEWNLFSFGYSVMDENIDGSRDRIEEHIRQLLEDCDKLQGFNCHIDVNSGFAGLAQRTLSYLSEECPRNPVVCLGMELPLNSDHDIQNSWENELPKMKCQLLNLALSTSTFSTLSSVYIPVSVPSVEEISQKLPFFDVRKPFHTSALISSAFSNLSTPYMANLSSKDIVSVWGHGKMLEWSRYIVPRASANFLSLSLSFPSLAPESEDHLQAILADLPPLTPSHALCSHSEFIPLSSFASPQILHSNQEISSSGSDAEDQKHSDLLHSYSFVARGVGNIEAKSLSRLYDPYLGCSLNASYRDRVFIKNGISIPVPYPRFFGKQSVETGDLQRSSAAEFMQDRGMVQDHGRIELPVSTILQCSSSPSSNIQRVADFCSMQQIASILFQFERGGLSRDDIEEAREVLYSLADSLDDQN